MKSRQTVKSVIDKWVLCKKLVHMERHLLEVSDNGSTIKSEDLKMVLANHCIEWKFNVALAPWWGGFFERLVRSTQ